MKRLAIVLVSCACLLTPASAFADDGGWLDWLYRLDPRFTGIASDFHLLCLDESGQKLKNCEEFFGLRHLFGEELKADEQLKFPMLRHEINLRVGYYRTRGDLYAVNPKDTANAVRVMMFYAYHPNDHLVLSAGAGVMPFYGHDLVETRWSGVFTPLSLRFFPTSGGCDGSTIAFWCGLGKGFFAQMESSYITHIPTPDLFVNYPAPPTPTATSEWNASFGFGFDFRRRHFGR